MFKETGGFHNFKDAEVEDAKKNGWVDGESIRQKLMDAKIPPESSQSSAIVPPLANTEEVVTIQHVAPQDTPPRRPGRPRNVAPSIMNDVEI